VASLLGRVARGRKPTVLRAYAVRYLLPLVEADAFGVDSWERGAHLASGLVSSQSALGLKPLSEQGLGAGRRVLGYGGFSPGTESQLACPFVYLEREPLSWTCEMAVILVADQIPRRDVGHELRGAHDIVNAIGTEHSVVGALALMAMADPLGHFTCFSFRGHLS
jgi:hypothetical protein